MAILEFWEDFRRMAYSDELLIAIGALLLIFGVIRIVRSSLTMLLWVILSGIGLTAISQGLDKSPFQIASNGKEELRDYIDSGKELSADVLNVLCRRLDDDLLRQQVESLPQQNEN